jgi:hypothetical protein
MRDLPLTENESTEVQAPNTRLKTANTKIQAPKKFQIPSANTTARQRVLELGAWDFLGAWCLEFGFSAGRQL